MGCFSSKILKELATLINFNLYIPWFPCQGVEKWIPLLHSNRHWLESARFWLVSSQVDRLCTPISARKKYWHFMHQSLFRVLLFLWWFSVMRRPWSQRPTMRPERNMVLRKRKPFSSAQVQAKCHELGLTKTKRSETKSCDFYIILTSLRIHGWFSSALLKSSWLSTAKYFTGHSPPFSFLSPLICL